MRVPIIPLSGRFILSCAFLSIIGSNGWGQVPQDAPSLQSDSQNSATTDTSAAKASPQSPVEHSEALASGSDISILRVIGGLGLVLSLVVGGYFAARKFAPQYFAKSASEKNLKLIESLSIGEKRCVTIVEFDERRFLLGNTQGQITLLAELPGRLSLVAEPKASPALTFAAMRDKPPAESFKSLYDVERGTTPKPRHIPPDIRAKMRQLRESLER